MSGPEVTRVWLTGNLPCPRCGQHSLIGYSYTNANGEHMHTRYRCTFWPSGRMPDGGYERTTPCDWDGWSVPGWRSDEEAQVAMTPAERAVMAR